MRHPYTQLHVHAVWATWDRAPVLDEDLAPAVHAAIAAKARSLGCDSVHVGGVADHVHLLVGLPPSLAVADLVGQCKGAASYLINSKLRPGLDFRWQGAYGAFTVGHDGLAAVQAYVADQPRRHQTGAVSSEFETCEAPCPKAHEGVPS